MMLAPGFIAMNQSNFLVPTHAMWAGFIFYKAFTDSFCNRDFQLFYNFKFIQYFRNLVIFNDFYDVVFKSFYEIKGVR